VSQRTRELGVRLALGAGARDILRLLYGRGFALVAVGSVPGLVIAIAGGRVVEKLSLGLQPMAAFEVLGVLAAVVGVTAVALYFPTQRALRLDPMLCLKAE
jgi:ABC-type antimicrobial peptide transport system permease subunit